MQGEARAVVARYGTKVDCIASRRVDGQRLFTYLSVLLFIVFGTIQDQLLLYIVFVCFLGGGGEGGG